jgi:hypothetical protein
VLAISFLTQSYEHFVGGILRLYVYIEGVARIPSSAHILNPSLALSHEKILLLSLSVTLLVTSA